MMMAVWSPKAEIVGSPLRISVPPLSATFSLRRTPARIRRIHALPRSSFHGSPQPSDEKPSPAIGRSDGRSASSDVAAAGSGSDPSLPRPATVSKLFRRRPLALWKRILFASKKVRSIILLNVVTVVYASDIPVLKEVEAIMDPALFTVVRFSLSTIPFLPFVFQARGDPQIRSSGIELGLWVSLGYLSQALGLLTSDAGRASFLSAFTVIVVPLVDGLFGATVSPLTWSGAFISLIGVALLECGGSPPSVGDVLNLLSAVFFGIHIFRTEHISRTTKREKFLALLGYEVCVVAFSSAIWFLFRDIVTDTHRLSLETWGWSKLLEGVSSFPWIPVLYTGVFSTGLCLWAEMDAMRDVSATETAIIYGLEPVWGAAFAWCLLGERWGASGWIGAALVLCGSLTVQILGSGPEKPDKIVEGRIKPDYMNADKKLTLSTIVIDPQKNTTQLLRKKDKS